MSIEVMSLNFEDLISIPAVELSEKVPPDVAVQVTLKTFQAGAVSNCDVYKSWATLLFQHYGASKISDENLTELLNVFALSIKELINACQDDKCSDKSKDLLAFLSYTLELFTWVNSVTMEFSLHEITSFLGFGLTVVENYLAVIPNKKHFRRFLEKSLTVQKLILHILSSGGAVQSFGEKDVVIFGNLVSQLCSIGEKTPKLDIKTAVDTWKATIKLMSQNTALRVTNEIGGSTWLARPMEFLIREIGRNVESVYNENSLTEPVQQIEKYLKVTNFYLRLLQKVASDFRHVEFPVCKEYVDNLVVVYSPPPGIVGSPIEKLVAEYVSKGYKELIQFAYKNPQFFEVLLSKQSLNFEENERLHEILLDALELAIRRNEIKFLDDQAFWKIFQDSLKSSYMFLSTSSYHRFVEVFAALQIYYRPEQFEKELIKSLLQEDIVLAISAIDVWCIVFRNSPHSERSTYFTFWREINENFLKFSTQRSSLYVEFLLKNLYSLLTIQEKEDLWSVFDPRMLTNDRFLLTIGLEAIPHDNQKRKVIQHYLDELHRFLKECPRDMTIDNFYSIIKDIRLLTPIALNVDGLIDILLQYLDISIKHKKFDLLTESILNFLAPKVEFIKDHRILKILTDLSTEFPRFEGFQMKFCLFRFLTSVGKNWRFKEHTAQMLKIFEKDKLINYFECKKSPPRTNRKPNDALLRQIFKMRSLEPVEGTHVGQDEDDVPAKKVKRDVDELIESLETTVDKIYSIARTEPLDLSRIRIIKRIVDKLQTIDGS